MSSDQIWPILLGLSVACNILLLLRKPIAKLLHREEEVSEDEIMAMVEEGEESGAIESNEKELIENIFEFNNTTAEDVMIHRTDMVCLSVEDDDDTVVEAIRSSGLSRFPCTKTTRMTSWACCPPGSICSMPVLPSRCP